MADRRKNDPYNPRVNYYPETQDVVVWQRFRDMVLREALNPVWCSELHRLHHLGRISADELVAAERYAREVGTWRKCQGLDVTEYPIGSATIDIILDNRSIMKLIRKGIPVVWRDRLDDIVIRNEPIVASELGKARRAMILLRDLFHFENKRATKK